MFENMAIRHASSYLSLMLTPTCILADKQRIAQIELHIRRNRILDRLEKESATLSSETKAMLCSKINALRTFFGNEANHTNSAVSFGMLADTIDNMICKKTIESLQDNGQALTPKEKLHNEKVRDQILKLTEEKVKQISSCTFENFQKLLNVLEGS